MSNSLRVIRGLANDPACWICGELEEDGEHILRLCPAARLVWQALGVESSSFFTGEDFPLWLMSNLEEGNKHYGEDWRLIFAFAVWWIWKWRNSRCFEQNPNLPFDQATFILARVGEFKRAGRMDMKTGKNFSSLKEEILISWKGPPEGWVKLNTDGAAKGNPGPAGAGGIVRGHRGEVLELFSVNCGSCSNTMAELLGVLRGLALCWNGGHRKVMVNVDSKVVLGFLTQNQIPPSRFFHLVNKCRNLVARPGWEVKLSHCYREANRVADWLANFGVCSEFKFVIHQVIPRDLRILIAEDLSGVSWPRLVPK